MVYQDELEEYRSDIRAKITVGEHTPCLVPNPKFKIRDRVKREIDIYNPGLGVLHGVVIEVYAQDGGYDGTTWHDPEVYAVAWDGITNGKIHGGYFPHGLDPE